jgi:Concanavalin A-like lectin/glucanases superfamily
MNQPAFATRSAVQHRHPRRVASMTGGLVLFASAVLTGCGGGGTTSLPNTSGTVSAVNYSGPPPATADVQLFKLNVWDKLIADNRCGSCHSTGDQTPEFVRADDINLAYAAANSVIDLDSPEDSRLVSKVGGGHNCWLSSDSACADILTAYIEAWIGGTAGGGKTIELKPPVLKDPGNSRNFPDDSGLFASTVYPLVTVHCVECHVESAVTARSPFFASPDVDAAYAAARAKIDLDTPANSRLVVRLRNEFHNCWSSDCQSDADKMEAAISAFAGQVPLTAIDPQLVTSKALTVTDGIVASGGSRYENDVIALYEFKTGTGSTAFDTSGVDPALDLNLIGDVNWVGGWGLDITSGKAQGSTAASRKLHDLIRATGEYSIEAWVVPANVTQEGPARIISYSAGTGVRNFTLGQTKYNYNFLNRSSSTDANGEPDLSTADADEDLQATQQHVVVTYDPVNGRRVYVNGVFTDDLDPVPGGNIIDWDNSFALVLGNEVSGDRQWQGKLRLVAIHNRALTPEQVAQNFAAGVGEKFFLLFSVADLTGVPESYILFEVSQFDNYSYLFNAPRFISLDPDAVPDNIPLAGMRIGVNGKEAAVGQAYVNLDTEISSLFYTSEGQTLSNIGTVIPLDKGPQDDEFFLTFEVLGSNTHVVIEPQPLQAGTPPDLPPAPDIGLRTFDEINATMAAVTGVSTQQAAVKTTYTTIRQQLPGVESIEGFLSAHQMAIAQLAIEYCNALLDDQGQITRAAYFPTFNFNQTADTAFDTAAQRDAVIVPMLAGIMGTDLTTQPDPVAVTGELDNLIAGLTACAGGPSPTCATTGRTREIVKATCAATLGSAVMLLQ